MALPDFKPFASALLETCTRKCRLRGTGTITSRQAILDRIRDKLARIERGGLDDSEDAWLDVAGYAAIGWLWDRGLWGTGKPLVYLAYPMDFGTVVLGGDPAEIQRNVPECSFFIPAMGWVNGKGSRTAMRLNEAIIRECDLLVALWDPARCSSVGVPLEMKLARDLNIPVWLCPASPSAYLTSLASRCFASLSEVVDALRVHSQT